MRCPFLYIGDIMDYGKEINELIKELKLDEVYPCDGCLRRYERFCSNDQCVETLTRMKHDNNGNTDI